MNVRPLVLLSIAVVILMSGFAFLSEARLPEGAEFPVHWNMAGEPDDFAPALTALLTPAGVLLALATLFALIPAIEPLQEKLAGSAPVLTASWIGSILLLAATQIVVALPAWGMEAPSSIIMLGIGLLLVIVGNALPKSRPGFFVGIRTPWTITDTDNWIATHRLGGKLMMAAGVVVILAALLPIAPEMLVSVVTSVVVIAAAIPIIYSWWFWHSRRKA